MIDTQLPSGLDLIAVVKHDPATRRIPLVALGTDDDPVTVACVYDAGANTYIVKPVTFLALVRLMKVLSTYWFETAELPAPAPARVAQRPRSRCAYSPCPPTTPVTRPSARCSRALRSST